MPRPRTVDYAVVLRLREQGLSYPAIGRELGIHHTTALYACNKAYRDRKNKRDSERAKTA